ncbi:tyrosine-type recombinase/integrase [Nitrospira tepida]|uniref:tyrosine-type recombinase/integrase n=1 Tax=Nitrospira tepida TaxID=2973512 RepID=UPI00259C8642|nr:site-specific integrase [Nitrospira tepida]
MARVGRKDRGLLAKKDSAGKLVWFVRLYHEGRERRFGSFPNKTKAREFYEKAKLEQKEGRFFPERYQHGGYEPVDAVIDRYLLTIGAKKQMTQVAERYFAEWWKNYFAGKRLNAITVTALEEARQSLLATVVVEAKDEKGTDRLMTPQRVNRYMEWLRHVLNGAARQGKLANNPVLKLSMYKEPKGKTRFLSLEEEKALLKQLGSVHGSWARLAILTGLRQAEQFRLQWKDVDLERGILTLLTTKAGGVQYVHLNEEAKAILRGFDSWQRSKWVFPSENPATPLDARNFYGRVWMPAVKDAGIEWATWHDLRHTFASRLAMTGHNEGTIAALLRHSTTALVKRYAHLSPSHLKAAVEGVAGFGKTSERSQERGVRVEESTSISDGTVTETVMPGSVGEKSGNLEAAEVGVTVGEKIGAPDTN